VIRAVTSEEGNKGDEAMVVGVRPWIMLNSAVRSSKEPGPQVQEVGSYRLWHRQGVLVFA
jgi:hypothetical protein